MNMDEEKEKIVSVYEDARSESNVAVWAIHLQVQRLLSEKREIEDFVFQPVVDFHFLVTALNRLRKMAGLVSKYANISKAIKQFDEALPDLIKIRNVLEHLDEYRLGEGRNKKVKVSALRTIVLGNDKIEWLDYEIEVDQAIRASVLLFQAIKDNAPEAYVEKVNEAKSLRKDVNNT